MPLPAIGAGIADTANLGVRIHEHLGEDVRHASQLRGRQHSTFPEIAL